MWPDNLQELWLYNNNIVNLTNIIWPAGLKKVWLYNNKIIEIKNIIWPDSLEELYMHRNNIFNLKNVNFPVGLKIFALDHNKISSLDKINWPIGLQSLWIDNNQLTGKEDINKHFSDTLLTKLIINNNVLAEKFCKSQESKILQASKSFKDIINTSYYYKYSSKINNLYKYDIAIDYTKTNYWNNLIKVVTFLQNIDPIFLAKYANSSEQNILKDIATKCIEFIEVNSSFIKFEPEIQNDNQLSIKYLTAKDINTIDVIFTKIIALAIQDIFEKCYANIVYPNEIMLIIADYLQNIDQEIKVTGDSSINEPVDS